MVDISELEGLASTTDPLASGAFDRYRDEYFGAGLASEAGLGHSLTSATELASKEFLDSVTGNVTRNHAAWESTFDKITADVIGIASIHDDLFGSSLGRAARGVTRQELVDFPDVSPAIRSVQDALASVGQEIQQASASISDCLALATGSHSAREFAKTELGFLSSTMADSLTRTGAVRAGAASVQLAALFEDTLSPLRGTNLARSAFDDPVANAIAEVQEQISRTLMQGGSDDFGLGLNSLSRSIDEAVLRHRHDLLDQFSNADEAEGEPPSKSTQPSAERWAQTIEQCIEVLRRPSEFDAKTHLWATVFILRCLLIFAGATASAVTIYNALIESDHVEEIQNSITRIEGKIDHQSEVEVSKSEYLSKFRTAFVTGRGIVRVRPQRSSKMIVRLAYADEVRVIEKRHSWSQIAFRSKLTGEIEVGWIWRGSIEEVE